MGFEARRAVLGVLDEALGADPDARVRVVAYDLNEPVLVGKLEQLGARLKIIIDDEGAHGKADSAETAAAARLAASAGAANVLRQHVGNLQHNKTIVVDGPRSQAVACGSTNFSWRGFFVQSNNAVVIRGPVAVSAFAEAFDNYWSRGTPGKFGATTSASEWNDLGLAGIDAKVAFSPHAAGNARLEEVADDIAGTTSSLLYSLAFLYQTPGVIKDAIVAVTKKADLFVYGISDRKVGGIDLQKPDGNLAPVYPVELSGNLPEPFKSEPVGGGGTRMHHKFVVIDFDKPTARVYMGSYNFSIAADRDNGECLLAVRDRRIAVSYAIEAMRMFDHWHFRVAQAESKKKGKPLSLARPPRSASELPWWREDYSDARKIRDRELFAPPDMAQPMPAAQPAAAGADA
jgi:phosphatidylserine/phosphatidylglycerophosphate/cardiolipin synthase-like enzyme